MFKGDHQYIFSFENFFFNIAFFLDSSKARSLKLCMVITLLGVHIVMVGTTQVKTEVKRDH